MWNSMHFGRAQIQLTKRVEFQSHFLIKGLCTNNVDKIGGWVCQQTYDKDSGGVVKIFPNFFLAVCTRLGPYLKPVF